MQNRVFIGLGSNLGDRGAAIDMAAAALQGLALPKTWVMSSLYETRPVGGGGGDDYLNAVCSFETALSAEEIHRILICIEQEAGRIRTVPNAPRTLDLDLLFFGHEKINTPKLTVPHPRLHERAFVLVPLNEIASVWKHPGSKQTAAEMLALISASDLSGVKKHDFDQVCQTVPSRS